MRGGCSNSRSWLGGLDSNQDSQIQSLESYQLDDLPADPYMIPAACYAGKPGGFAYASSACSTTHPRDSQLAHLLKIISKGEVASIFLSAD